VKVKSLRERRKICNHLGERYYPLETRRDRLMESVIEANLPSGGVFLDAGCGPSLRLAALFANGQRLSVGVDLEPFRAPAGNPTQNVARGVVGDLGMLPFAPDSMDVIAMRSVVEHLADPPAALSGMARVLKPGGCVVALAPSRWYYASIVGRLMPPRLARSTLEFIYGPTAYDNYPTWYRANTPRAMERAAREAGLSLVMTRVCAHPPDYLKFSPALFLLGVAFDRLTALVPALRTLQPSFLFLLRRP
jgi:SAM-dependent methyltransferase